jgi:sugar phosphate isomerase/epimerase
MKFAYNSNGWRYVPVETAFERLVNIGYDGVELGVQPNHLPPESWSPAMARTVKALAADLGLAITNLHLGAPHLLSGTPHEPSFMALHARQRDERIDLVRRGIDFAAALGTNLVCFESGPLPADMARSSAFGYLIEGLEACLEHAEDAGIRIGIEPSPEHFIDGFHAYAALAQIFADSEAFGLCYDLGHAYCVFEDSPAVIATASDLFHVHIEDMAGRVHRHLRPGDGDMDLATPLAALQRTGFDGFVSVDLMDHTDNPDAVARHCLAHLRAQIDTVREGAAKASEAFAGAPA